MFDVFIQVPLLKLLDIQTYLLLKLLDIQTYLLLKPLDIQTYLLFRPHIFSPKTANFNVHII